MDKKTEKLLDEDIYNWFLEIAKGKNAFAAQIKMISGLSKMLKSMQLKYNCSADDVKCALIRTQEKLKVKKTDV